MKDMRRKKQQLSEEKAIEILINGSSGVLGLNGDDGYPYTVPLNYFYADGKLFFHCAKAGYKIDCINRSDKASFCVVEKDRVVPHIFSTDYSSVIAFGKIKIITNEKEKRNAIVRLTEKYCMEHMEEGHKEIDMAMDRLCMLEMTIEHFTGKSASAMVQNA